MTLGELAQWMARSGASFHLRALSDGRFCAVAHRTKGDVDAVAYGKDLDSLITDVTRDLDERAAAKDMKIVPTYTPEEIASAPKAMQPYMLGSKRVATGVSPRGDTTPEKPKLRKRSELRRA